MPKSKKISNKARPLKLKILGTFEQVIAASVKDIKVNKVNKKKK